MEYNHASFDPGMGELVVDTAIAVVGMSCRFSQVRGIDEYWDLLSNGREAIRTYSEEELIAAGCSPSMLRNRNYVPRGAPLDDMECFDATLFGLSPRDAAIMDPQHRHFLECTWEALENAGHTPQRFDGVIGVYAGSGHNAYMPYNLLTNSKLVQDVGLFLLRHTSNDKDFLTTRVSYLFDLKGPSINVQTACSTSLVSIHMAAQSLLNGECDMAIAGGSSIELPHRQGYLYEEGEILSPDGHCRPFDAESQGTVFGSGVAVVVLRRLADAIEAGDHIYAVLRGSAINNDGAGKVGYLAPSVDGQAKVIAEALAMADFNASSVSYVEAHGTGTPVGDPIELAALTHAFRQTSDNVGHCSIGSVKANIGHTDTAAGAAGLIKVALALHNRELPASVNFEAPNPALALEGSPFRVQDKFEPWTTPNGTPRRAGISSLGVGGTNAHVVLEEAPPRPDSGPTHRRSQLLLCSAKTSVTAKANAGAMADFMDHKPDINLPDTAFTLAVGRQHLPYRYFAVADSSGEAARQLREAASNAPIHANVPDRPVAFLFCGAGPQHVDMARDLYDAEPHFVQEVDKGLALLDDMGASDVRRWLFPCDADREQAMLEMARPSIALPALFVVQTALARLWMSIGVRPSAMIGHSSGEYAAAHLAGVIDLQSSLRIVRERGRLFETISDGGMLSIAATEAEILPLLPAELSIAAINSPKLCVVSGPAEAIEHFRAELTRCDIEAQLVPIAVAAHSPMLEPILPEFRNLLHTIEFAAPQIPFVSNPTGDWALAAEVRDPEYWVRHLRQTVRFTDGLHRLLSEQECAVLEVGPGRSMASLVRQHPDCGRDRPVISTMRHPGQSVKDDAAWLDALGHLWSAGVVVDWDAYWQDEKRLRVPLPTYQFERQRHWYEPGTRISLGQDDAAGSRRCDDIAQWQYEPVWSRSFQAEARPVAGPALVLEDVPGVGREIAAQIRDAGRDVIMLRAGNRFARLGEALFSVNPSSQSDYGRLFEILSAEGRLPVEIYHGWLITGGARRQPDTTRLLELGFHSLIAMARELAYHVGDGAVEIAILTDRTQRVAGDRDLMPVKAAALGAASVVPAEYPGLQVRSIDIVVPKEKTSGGMVALAAALVREMAGECDGRALAFRDGERWVQDFVRVPPESTGHQSARSVHPVVEGTYLITGGLGGLGLTIAARLAAERKGVRILLAGRSALPPRDEWAGILAGGFADPMVEERIRKLVALEAAGATVEVIAVDIGNTPALRTAIRRATSRLGPIYGVFHTAGVLDDGLIETKARSAMDVVLRPKIAGTLALEQALEGQHPQFMMLFSSISAFAGLPGQADYAAANAFLDAYAQSRKGQEGPRVISVGWSPWREVGMAARLDGNPDPLADDLGEGKAVDHPFLETLHLLSVDELVVSSTLSPEKHWLLDEHRLTGEGTLIPGTGFLELARFAHALLNPGAVALSEVMFLTPFAVPDGAERALRVHLKRRVGENWRFSILGRPDDSSTAEWTEHASGQIFPAAGIETPVMVDIARVEARCATVHAGKETSSSVLAFGPRWSNVQRAAYGDQEAVLHLAMDTAFHADFERILLHPALLDFATAGAQSLIPGYVPGQDFFAPFSYGRLVLHAPLPPSIVSHIRFRPTGAHSQLMAHFDVTIADTQGRVLAEISEFAMMRIQNSALLTRGRDRVAAVSPRQSAPVRPIEGIFPEEGLAVIDRLLEAPARPHIVISPSDMTAVLADLRAAGKPVPRDAAATRTGEDAELPVTAMEKTIAELWSDLLGIHPICRQDNFFDLGGHSLLAVQFTNRLRKKTGKTLPLAALLESPTVAALAHELDPAGRESTDEASNDNAAGSDAPQRRDVITIRGGGSLTPIFFVHDGLGETLLYRGLVTRLDPNRPVYGIEPLRTTTGGFAHTRIDEMAANYIERMRSVQSHGPYLIAGLCAGGVIAFEMAQQLQEAGEMAAYVGVIDAADVAASKRSFHIARGRIRRVSALLQEQGASTLLPELVRRAANAFKWEIQSRLDAARDRRMAQQIRGANRAENPDVQTSGAPALPFLKLYEVAHTQHRPKGLLSGGNVFVFKASGGNGEVDDTPYQEIYSDVALGWGKRVADQVTLVSVPGGHSSALQEPHVRTLAPLFQEAIDSAMERARQVWVMPDEPGTPGIDAIAAE